jgi:hypothetical protein
MVKQWWQWSSNGRAMFKQYGRALSSISVQAMVKQRSEQWQEPNSHCQHWEH